jgi:hypothetical protein
MHLLFLGRPEGREREAKTPPPSSDIVSYVMQTSKFGSNAQPSCREKKKKKKRGN